ncbi:hypothetical protein [Actinacidiphila bryophytorum]|uniref:Cell division protein FtsL n=1 Tax=Actinacidiphila bryophytorum TaxID=1436133 RepID=A0A9W4GZP7_9ACTN|nr:hypothetical protein [Actinacidiphila bryophytorum]MBM9436261.1 hypothetical protein [Actinacidiphila bryophytorum]CAG7632487.1 conserved hypothetical protein [Actinacidiphila bryophytorum]
MSPVRGRTATAARAPFVILVVTLLAGGLISLLLLNAAVNQDSFQLNKLEKETTGYTDEQQQLQQEVDQYGAPGTLERKARDLGMVPGGNPAFLGPDGSVLGTPERATAPPPPPRPTAPSPSPGKPTGTTAPPSSPPASTPPPTPTPPTSTPGR